MCPARAEPFLLPESFQTVSPAALRNRGGSYNKLIIRQFETGNKNALEHKKLMFRWDSGKWAIRRKAAGRRQSCASPPGESWPSRESRHRAPRRYVARPSRSGVTFKPYRAASGKYCRSGICVRRSRSSGKKSAGNFCPLALAVFVQRITAPNRRRSAGATPDFSPGTAYDFKFFLSRHKITGKRGAVADVVNGGIPDGQNIIVVV